MTTKIQEYDSMVDRVRHYNYRRKGTEALEMAVISPRAVVVYDSMGEYDVFFDGSSYISLHPSIWDEGRALFPNDTVKKLNIGILPGKGRAPQIRSFEEALAFAQQQLKPWCKEAEFCEKPIEIAA